MQKSQLKKIIKECLMEIIAEGDLSLRVNGSSTSTTQPIKENFVAKKVNNVNKKNTYSNEQLNILNKKKQQQARLIKEQRKPSYGAGSMFDDLIANATGGDDDILGPGLGGSGNTGDTSHIVNNAHNQDFSKFSNIFENGRL